jgi:hypothetical protein
MGSDCVVQIPLLSRVFYRSRRTMYRFVLVAQQIAHQTSELGFGSSSPPRDFWVTIVFVVVWNLALLFHSNDQKFGVASLAEWLRRWL